MWSESCPQNTSLPSHVTCLLLSVLHLPGLSLALAWHYREATVIRGLRGGGHEVWVSPHFTLVHSTHKVLTHHRHFPCSHILTHTHMHTFIQPHNTCTPSTKCPSSQWALGYLAVTPTLASRLLAVMLRTLPRLAAGPAPRVVVAVARLNLGVARQRCFQSSLVSLTSLFDGPRIPSFPKLQTGPSLS